MDAARSLFATPPDVADEALWPLVLLLEGRRCVVLTGAGVSTESGIPDYRGAASPRRARRPMRWQEFADDEEARRRYWARAVLGWPQMQSAAPNPAHVALAALERAGSVRGVVTQNVDGLHHKAGSARVVELHGSLYEVVCLGCGARVSREALQARVLEDNPAWRQLRAEALPDGDAELSGALLASFRAPACLRCSGPLKPDVVFFGDQVPPSRVAMAGALVDEAEVLLVAGSSLAVHSGLRFVRRAAARRVPVVVINLGETLGDRLATVRVEGRAGDVLPRLARALGALS